MVREKLWHFDAGGLRLMRRPLSPLVASVAMPRDDGNSPDVLPKSHEEKRTWAEPSAAYLGRQPVPPEEVDAWKGEGHQG